MQEAFLSADSHIRGRVVFEGMDLTLFDPVTGTSNIRRNKVKNITLEEVIVLGIGLGLQPEEIDDLVEKSPAKYDRSERCTIIRILTRRLYQYPVTTFNEAMIACGQEPLTYAS